MQRRSCFIGLLLVRLVGVGDCDAAAGVSTFHPVSLDKFYQRLFSSYGSNQSWGLVPRGMTNFAGVPFGMFGKIDLAGLGRARDGEFQPARIGPIPVMRSTARIHLLHGASYDAPDETPILALRVNYADGSERKLFVRYGVHVRNWYVERTESSAALSDPRSQVIWHGNTRADDSGTPTRLFKTTFDNPQPDELIRDIDLLSLFARANSVVLAITLESGPVARRETVGEDDDFDLRREILVRTLDEETQGTLSNIVVELSVTEGTREYGFGRYRSDRLGQVLIDYPPGKFQRLYLRASGTNVQPGLLEQKSESGVYTSDLPIFLKAH